MNILITGACGHIGSYLVENLHKIKKVKKAFLIDNLESNRLDTLFNYKRKNKIEFFKRDLTDPKSLKGFKNINIVIHLASMTNAAKSFNLKKEMYSNNLNLFSELRPSINNSPPEYLSFSLRKIVNDKSALPLDIKALSICLPYFIPCNDLVNIVP